MSKELHSANDRLNNIINHMIFNKYNNCKLFSNNRICLEELVSTIKDNPQKSDIIKLRELQYKSAQYDKLKLNLSAVTPHGTFTSAIKDSLDCLSGYLYFDIDGFSNKGETEDTIKLLNNEFPITLICKSVGGRGLAFLLKVNGVTKGNFDTIHAFIRYTFKKKGYKIDDAAGGLIRKWIITYDPDIIYNKVNEYIIDWKAYEEFAAENKTETKKIKRKETESDINADPADADWEIIPFETLSRSIKTESEYKGKIEGDFTIEEMEYYKIIYPPVIKDGAKHRTYIRIMNALYYLNEEITQQQVFSYLYYVNSASEKRMERNKLLAIVKNICSNIEKTGEIMIKTRIKKIHFNSNSDFKKGQKQSMAAKINGALRSNKTKDAIQQAVLDLEASNIKVTKAKIAEMLNISERTIQRSWNKEKIEISSLNLTSHNGPKKIINTLDEFDYEEEYIAEDSEKINSDISDFFD